MPLRSPPALGAAVGRSGNWRAVTLYEGGSSCGRGGSLRKSRPHRFARFPRRPTETVRRSTAGVRFQDRQRKSAAALSGRPGVGMLDRNKPGRPPGAAKVQGFSRRAPARPSRWRTRRRLRHMSCLRPGGSGEEVLSAPITRRRPAWCRALPESPNAPHGPGSADPGPFRIACVLRPESRSTQPASERAAPGPETRPPRPVQALPILGSRYPGPNAVAPSS
jgi:hypothetical protein